MSTETMKSSATMSEKIVENLGDIVVTSLEATAEISLGQGLLRVADRFLWVVEKSAEWSLPVQEVNTEENGKAFGKTELVRPLPWIFFLPSLVMLRACRVGLNVGAAILGYPKLQTTGMVKFIQKSRRRLRAIKSSGLRNMRYRKGSRNKEEEVIEAKKSLIASMLSTLSALSCLETSRRTPSPPPTRVYVQHTEPETTSTPEEQSTTESTSPQVDAKRKYSEITGLDDSNSDLQSEEESTDAKMERLAAEGSEADDQDFDPAEEELISSESSSAGEDDEDYLSESEIKDLRAACLLNAVNAVAKVIVEEPEPEPEQNSEKYPEQPVDKISASNKIGEKKSLATLQLPKETEDNKLQVELLTPGTDAENITNFYSPISSPGDSISDFNSPFDNDAKESIFVEEEVIKTAPNVSTDPASILEENSALSGINPEGAITATRNGTTEDKGTKASGNSKVFAEKKK